MVRPDDGPYIPPLEPDAGPNERLLHEVYGFSRSLVEDTATDWGLTADGVESLATAVREVITKLRTADEPWEGPAATSAFSTLRVLATVLDDRAEEIRDIKRGLDKAVVARDTAVTEYASQVRSVSTDVDKEDYRAADGTINAAGYSTALDGKREQRESAAQKVLASFDAGMGTAAKQMPVEAPKDSVMVDPGAGGAGGGTGGGGGGGTTGGGGGYTPPSGGPVGPPKGPTGYPPVDPPVDPPYHPPTGTVDPPVVGPHPPTGPTGPGVDLDGGTTGTTAPTPDGSTTWAGTTPGSGVSSSGSGMGAGAAGAGGLLGGGAALLGRGGLGRGGVGLPGGGRSGPLVAGSTGAAGRGSTSAGGARATTGSGRPVVAAGSQGQAGRGGRGGSGGVRGARGGGRYGVPKLDRSGGGAGRGVVAGSGAGGRGKKDRDEAVDVESLTHEDEKTWFEGEDEAGPSVWR